MRPKFQQKTTDGNLFGENVNTRKNNM